MATIRFSGNARIAGIIHSRAIVLAPINPQPGMPRLLVCEGRFYW
jgi:hypothetical protein